MQNFNFVPASKKQSKLRLALYGASGSGKTLSALLIGKGIVDVTGGAMAVIDTENATASKYEGELKISSLEGVALKFDTLNMLEPTVENMVKAIKAAHDYDVLIVDSLSHAWKELLQEVERLAKAKYRGNTWSAWSEGTPMQQEMIKTIQRFPGHLIVTIRAKTEWTLKDENGKNVPTRVGLAPEQGKGIEYEFDMLGNISPEHYMLVEKDRSGLYQDQIIQKPGIALGEELLEWLEQGKEQEPQKTKDDLIAFAEPLGMTREQVGEALKQAKLQFDPYLWDEMRTAVTNYANGIVLETVS